ncbi:lamin tail domain-containing protein [Lysobacter humi (ex Lee et al. 2017)]
MNRTSQRVAALSLAIAASLAGTAQAQVVISQVYGGGGNQGAAFQHDFVELHNTGDTPVALAGLSLQYAATTGTNWSAFALGGSIPAGGYYLVRLAGNASSPAAPITDFDASGGLNLAGAAGKIALVRATTALTAGTACPSPAIAVDIVGFGTGTTGCAETRPTGNLSNTLAARRLQDGCQDTGINATDFEIVAPAPRSSRTAPRICGSTEVVLRIADEGMSEEDAGEMGLPLRVTLSRPAGPGGVRFRISTADGTATAADGDYIPLAGVEGLIPAGADEAEVRVLVRGDLNPEPDETFEVRLADVTGARVEDGVATAIIINDDFELVGIGQVQGGDARSPWEGAVVATRGVVTARRANGFYIQSRDIEADTTDETSEGLFVFTRTAPPAFVQPGRWVVARGSVVEYVPSTDPGQAPLTELGGDVLVAPVDEATYPLPAPVVLTPTFPDPTGPLDQLERVEGMRVTVPDFVVTAPTGGFTDERNATGGSNGVFHGTVAGVARPFREPGIQAPDAPPAGAMPPIPRWDFNPELISVDSDALGAPRLDVPTGTRIADLTGPLDYAFRRYTILPDSTGTVTPGMTPHAAKSLPDDAFTVAAYNLERFFDESNDPSVGEPVLTAAAFERRLAKASMGIRDSLRMPDILGIVEMENLDVLQRLAARVGNDAVAAGQDDPRYAAFLVEGNDVGGIDVGFLVKTADTGAGTPRVEVRSVQQIGKDTTWTSPGGDVELLNDRPPLLLDAVVHYADGRAFPLNVVIVHQRSLNGSDETGAGGERVRAKRQRQAEFLAAFLDARQKSAPDVRLVVLGDFNAFEFNDGLAHTMGTITGEPAANEATAVAGDGADLVEPNLVNLGSLEPQAERYSFVFGGNAQTLDHVLVNENMVVATRHASLDHARINADFPETNRSLGDSPSRLADHDPVVAYFVPRRIADLAVDAQATEARTGGTLRFDVALRNLGAEQADRPAIGFDLDAELPELTIAAPAGWGCDVPQAAGGRTVATCSTTRLADDATAAFSLSTPVAGGLLDRTILLTSAAEAESIDPQPANNAATAQATVVSQADLAAGLTGPDKQLRRGATGSYRASITNAGPDLAVEPMLEVTGEAPAAGVAFVAPAGWTCTVVTADGGFRGTCVGASLAAGTTQAFDLRVTAPLRRGQPHFTVRAAVASRSTDAVAGNDAATHHVVLTGPVK